jgi:hypothetical protein
MKEDWRCIDDGVYEVSNFGRVRRAKPGLGATVGRIHNGCVDGDGYRYVRLKNKHRSIHTLVAKAFLGPQPPNTEVNHKDLDKSNNRWDNLEYLTHKKNMRHAVKAGVFLGARCENNPASKLTKSDVKAIRELYKLGKETQEVLGQRFGVHQTVISHIVTGRTWRVL